MEEITEEEIKESKEANKKLIEIQKERISNLAGTKGTQKYYDCPICNNRGIFFNIDDNGYMTSKPCKCMAIRRAYKQMENDGVLEQVKSCNFDNYNVNTIWQKSLKELALAFCGDTNAKGIALLGQSGIGKSHLCCATFDKLTMASLGIKVEPSQPISRYVSWNKEVKRLIGLMFSNEKDYQEEMEELEKVPILYIDDFFKPFRNEMPTKQVLSIAFDLLEYRKNQKGLKTIISSELTISDICSIDEATGSRLVEITSDKYIANIKKDSSRNVRIHQELKR